MQKKYKRRSSRYERIAALAFTAAIIVALPLITSFRSHNGEGKGEDNKPIDIVSPGSAVGRAAVEISSAASKIEDPESLGDIAPITKSLGEFTLTAYCPCVKCCGKWSAEHPSRIGTDYIQKTASGTIPKAGRTIGVDPGIIPFGTVVIINDHEYVAEDRGGAVKGNSIDIFFGDHNEALEFGRQTAEVFIKTNL